jgi:hypothetical protein
VTPCPPEQYRPNPANFDIAIGKPYIWPKDIGAYQKAKAVGTWLY